MCPLCYHTHDHIICSTGATYTGVCLLFLFQFCLEDYQILWSGFTNQNTTRGFEVIVIYQRECYLSLGSEGSSQNMPWQSLRSDNTNANTNIVFEWMVPSRKLPYFWNAGTDENTTSSLKWWYQREYYKIFEVMLSMGIPPESLK